MTTDAPPPAIRIRWRIFGFLFGFGFIAYLQQKSITIAAQEIMPTLHLTQLQIGMLEQAFVVGYALFQMPGGVLGQRFGARRTLIFISILAIVAMLATAAAPAVFDGGALFVALLAAQLLLGLAQGAFFPVSAGVFSAWFPSNRWAIVQGLQTMGLQLGAAATPLLIAGLMLRVGWQMALVWTSVPVLGLIAWWAWYGRNTPGEHTGVVAQEMAEIGVRRDAEAAEPVTAARVWRVLKDRNALLLFVSYTCMNYVFYLLANWVFLYLIQERHFSVLESGVLATGPPLAAALGAGIGGVTAGGACAYYGVRWGYRWTPLISMPLAGLLLLVALYAGSAYLAVAALAACYLCVELTEGSYWGCAMHVGGKDTMALTGFMNTGGNLGGIIGIPIVAYLSGQHLWNWAFYIGVGFAFISAICWLGVNADRPVDATAL